MSRSGPEARGQDDVVGLDVAMEDAAFVGVLHGVGQRGDPARRQPGGHRLVPSPQPSAQAGPCAELGGDEVAQGAELAGVEDPNDVGMVEPGGGAGLAEEPADIPGAQHPLGQRHLQGHFAAQQPVARPDHEPEPAGAEVLDDLEPVQQRSGSRPVRLLVEPRRVIARGARR